VPAALLPGHGGEHPRTRKAAELEVAELQSASQQESNARSLWRLSWSLRPAIRCKGVPELQYGSSLCLLSFFGVMDVNRQQACNALNISGLLVKGKSSRF
jgi:hypothetical protein